MDAGKLAIFYCFHTTQTLFKLERAVGKTMWTLKILKIPCASTYTAGKPLPLSPEAFTHVMWTLTSFL